jgi:hypothetical protein
MVAVTPNLHDVDVILHAHQEWYLAKHFIPRYTNMEN